MKTIDQIQDEVVDEFSAFDDWMDKYALLIELGNSLSPLDEQFKMMKIIIQLYDNCREAVNQGVPFSKLLETGMFERVIKMKYDIPNDKSVMDDKFTDLSVDIDQAVKNVVKQCTEEGR